MNTERESRTSRPTGHVCRSCKQPVDAVVERHKSMGVYVPVWTAGPCHNGECPDCVPEEVHVSSVRRAVWRNLSGRNGG
ncbi:hypothetical protein AB0L04_29125 [Streptomyces glaucescens]|uniref:hypothetical protein n=1 Tax=Streptomyces glaucescens TaxID=1907 RepID=UPI00344B5991